MVHDGSQWNSGLVSLDSDMQQYCDATRNNFLQMCYGSDLKKWKEKKLDIFPERGNKLDLFSLKEGINWIDILWNVL